MSIKTGWAGPLALLALCAPLCAQGTLHVFHGAAAEDRLGISVQGAGDVNGDGYGDLIAGAHQADYGASNAGSAEVRSGKDGSLLFRFDGAASGDAFGRSVSGAGDVNNDGYADLIVGAHLSDAGGADAGLARVFSGRDGSVLFTFFGDDPGDQLGRSVSGAGDVDGDGHADLIVGAYRDDDGGADAGSARVFSGASGQVLFTHHGDAAGDAMGFAVSGAGDVDGDGFADVLAGAFGDDDQGSSCGSARLLAGPAGAPLSTWFGDAAGDWFGAAVSGGADATGDGIPDLLIGAYGADAQGSLSGAARLISGGDGAVARDLAGGSAGDLFGISVALSGDLDGDGRSELLVGAERDDDGGTDAGSASLFSGDGGFLLFRLDGEDAGDRFGFSVGPASDVNGDGRPDLIAGAHADDDGGSGAGSARVSSGSCGSLAGFGGGCPGTGGITPALGLSGCAVRLGTVTLSLDQGPGGAVAQVFLGTQSAQIPLKASCVLLVYPILLSFPLPLDGAGGAELDVRVPAGSPPASIFLQAFLPDPGAGSHGYSATNGVRLTLD